MQDIKIKKEQEIKNMVSILEQIDLPDILLLTRDANTLLLRQKEAWERQKKEPDKEVIQDVETSNNT